MNKNNDAHILDDLDISALTELGSLKDAKNGIMPILIIGEIEGHTELGPGRKATKYEHIIPMIIEAEENSDIEGVLIILNTMGGDVEAGLALSELIAGMKKPTVSLVLGGSHSIGVPLAVSTKYSLIAPTATMTIHPIRTTGLVIGVSQSFDYFKRMQERINKFIISHSSIKEKTLKELMLNSDELVNDVGSILIGKKAVDMGLINKVGTISDALDKLRELSSSNSTS